MSLSCSPAAARIRRARLETLGRWTDRLLAARGLDEVLA
jgi:hypothetical protein